MGLVLASKGRLASSWLMIRIGSAIRIFVKKSLFYFFEFQVEDYVDRRFDVFDDHI